MMKFECTCHEEGQFEICETCIAEEENYYTDEHGVLIDKRGE
jgi:hypothetical protein